MLNQIIIKFLAAATGNIYHYFRNTQQRNVNAKCQCKKTEQKITIAGSKPTLLIRVKNAQKIKQINIKILQSVMELFVKSMNANNVNTVILAKLLEAEWFYRL